MDQALSTAAAQAARHAEAGREALTRGDDPGRAAAWALLSIAESLHAVVDKLNRDEF